MRQVTIGRDIIDRDAYCQECGHPFDPGDTAYAVPDEWGDLAYSTTCARRLEAAELERTKADVW
jgi:hypothetical protein